MKNYYELLGLQPAAGAEDVKRAFRREIARYHPDKVQHLGPEFQEIASHRAAELTEAYRVLMDEEARRQYDERLLESTPAPAQAPHAPSRHAPPAAQAPPSSEPAAPQPPPRQRPVGPDHATMGDFVRRAAIAKLRAAADRLGGAPVPDDAFDVVFEFKGRKPLFKKAEPSVRLLAKVVSQVDPSSVEEAWGAASRAAAPGETLCLMLVGSSVSPARELATSVSELRRKARRPGPLVIPVDLRDWDALLPPETPPSVRGLLDHLRRGD